MSTMGMRMNRQAAEVAKKREKPGALAEELGDLSVLAVGPPLDSSVQRGGWALGAANLSRHLLERERRAVASDEDRLAGQKFAA